MSKQSNITNTSDDVEVMDLKKLLVSLKQQYEKTLQSLNSQLHLETTQKQTIQNELESAHKQILELKKSHNEELFALKQQQNTLKDLLKKNQEEIKQIKSLPQHDDELSAQQQRVEQLERVIPYLRERAEEANLETEQLREELEEAYKKIKLIQADLANARLGHRKQIEEIQSNLNINTSDARDNLNNQMLNEIESIKRSLLEGVQENNALEIRYADLLKEKLSLEQYLKQMQQQLEQQSSSLISLQEQIQKMGQQKKQSDQILADNNVQQAQMKNLIVNLEHRVRELNEIVEDKSGLHEHYELLKEECTQLTERLEETLDARVKAEYQLSELLESVKDQKELLNDQQNKLDFLTKDHESLLEEIKETHATLEETESKLKLAQQHLGKKVKETTILNEKLEEQQNYLIDSQQQLDAGKVQIIQLQNNIDMFQKQEKKLQDQLHEALKSTENQVAKWEEKYFKMYDKWQESEGQIRDLKKFEERYLQMQTFLNSLGNFIGPNHPTSFYSTSQEKNFEKPKASFDGFIEKPQNNQKPDYGSEDRNDLFNYRQNPHDPFNSNFT